MATRGVPMTGVVETGTRVHENLEGWSDIPPQEYLSRLRIGEGRADLGVDVQLTAPERSHVSTTLPPWLWDEVDWDDEQTYTTGTRMGIKTVGPTPPPNARYTVEKTIQRTQYNVHVTREKGWIEGREHADRVVEELSEFLDCDTRALQERLDEEDPDLWDDLKRAEEAIHELRLFLYENRGRFV